MKLSRVKDGIIVFLVVVCVVQTSKLWFGNFSIRNFFYSVSAKPTSYKESEALEAFLEPSRMVISEGNNRFRMVYEDKGELLSASHKALSQVMKKGKFVKSSVLENWEDVLPFKGVLYEYFGGMPSDIFVSNFPQKSNMLTNRTKQFHTVVIVPGKINSEDLKVFFIDTNNSLVHEYVLQQGTVNSSLSEQIEIALDKDTMVYQSTVLSGYITNGFSKNTNFFIPTWKEEDMGYTYSAVTEYNPYGEIVMNNLVNYMGDFFPTPSGVVPDTVNGVYTFIDQNSVVRYYQNDVLEYANYATPDSTVKADLLSSFGAAWQFIENDSTISNHCYMSNYEYSEEMENWIFYFDFTWDNKPMFFSTDALRSSSQNAEVGTGIDRDMNSMIEVTVTKGTVTKYRRYISAFRADTSMPYSANNGFIATMDDIYLQGLIGDDDESSLVDRIDFGFKVDGSNKLFLNWSIRIGGQSFVITAYNGAENSLDESIEESSFSEQAQVQAQEQEEAAE